MIFLQMICMYQDMQDTQRKYATNVYPRITLKEIVNGHFQAMIAERYIKRDQRYLDIVQIAGQRVCRLIEEEVILWEETDH